MRTAALPLLLSLLLAGPSAAAPARVVSLSLCADQFVLALAEPGRIAAVTRLAKDPNLSTAEPLARGVPHHRGSAEEVLALRPDLVVTGAYARGSTVQMLERLGVPVLRLKTLNRLEEVPGQVEAVAAALGVPERGAALASALRAGLDGAGPAGGRPTAALFRPGGEVPGTRSLVGDVMRRAGLDNVGDRYAVRPGAKVPLEALVLSPPEVMVVDSRRPDRPGIGQSILEHPALRAAPGMRQVSFPLRYWLCAGPDSLAGAAVLAEAVR